VRSWPLRRVAYAAAAAGFALTLLLVAVVAVAEMTDDLPRHRRIDAPIDLGDIDAPPGR